MKWFIARRGLQFVPLLLISSVVAFAIMQLAPGGPLEAYARSPRITPEQLDVIKHALGLDQSLFQQYVNWLNGVVKGDWGYSLLSGDPVLKLIGERLGNSLKLMGCAILVSVTLALALGVLSAYRANSKLDRVITVMSMTAYSVPVFFLALMLQLVFAVQLGWLPAAGTSTIGAGGGALDGIKHLILPVVALSVTTVAGWSRFLRTSLLETLGQDYLRTARAKGAPERTVLLRHALRNALVPFVTVVALDVPQFLVGALVVEVVFAWPGEGRLFYEALVGSDYPVIMGVLLMSALLILVCNLLADVLYSVLNPRVEMR